MCPRRGLDLQGLSAETSTVDRIWEHRKERAVVTESSGTKNSLMLFAMEDEG